VLILVRKVNQAVWLSGDICITVLDIQRGRVKLGVTAPDRVKVMRLELLAGEDARWLQREAGPAAAARVNAAGNDRR